ncbi:MAG: ABC transporter ATP-binding protein/permease [Ruminococcus sp.]|nr:ABC transporter ATP-binding protein/permease [Ruminococcus sp.]
MKSYLNITKRIFRDIFHTIPISAAIVMTYMVFTALVPAILTVLYEKLFDCAAYTDTESFHKALWLGFAVCFVYFIRYIFQAVYAAAMNAGVYEKVSFFCKSMISQKSSRLNLLDYEDASKMNLKGIAEDCVNQSKISSFFMNIMGLLTGFFGVLSITIVLSSYHIAFLPIAVLSVLPYLISKILRGKEFYRIREIQIPKLRVLNYIWHLLFDRQSVKEMKVMCSQKYVGDVWTENRKEIDSEIWKQRKKDSFILLFCDLLKIIAYVLSVFLSLILLKRDEIGIGVFAASISAFLSMQQQCKDLLIKIGESSEQIRFINKYYVYLDLPETTSGSVSKMDLQSGIHIQNVTFAYPNMAYTLNNISFSIKKGEKIAIVGENGSGKTTLAKIILGLYPPSCGSVLYDDINIHELDKMSKYHLLCAVTQDFVKYCLSYRENIAISDTDNIENTEKIRNTIASAGNEAVLEKIDIDDLLGIEFGGKELSGGEWQKTAIGRAIFKESELLIFDEPTSSLDPIVESDILTLLLNAMSDVTSILISHRVGVCRFVDKIAVLSKGELVEYGSHQELMSLKGNYYRLFMEQQQWYQ